MCEACPFAVGEWEGVKLVLPRSQGIWRRIFTALTLGATSSRCWPLAPDLHGGWEGLIRCEACPSAVTGHLAPDLHGTDPWRRIFTVLTLGSGSPWCGARPSAVGASPEQGHSPNPHLWPVPSYGKLHPLVLCPPATWRGTPPLVPSTRGQPWGYLTLLFDQLGVFRLVTFPSARSALKSDNVTIQIPYLKAMLFIIAKYK